MDIDNTLMSTGGQTADIHYHDMTARARAWRDSVEWACLNMKRGIDAGSGVRDMAAEWSMRLAQERTLKLSAERLRKIYGRWIKRGAAALVNGRLCGRAPVRHLLPDAVLAQFWSIYLNMKDKASKEAAWRHLIHLLRSGQPLNGGLTWQTLWLKLHRAAVLPERCPWSHHNPPPGWSLSAMLKSEQPSDLVMAISHSGIGAGRALAARQCGIQMDWGSLKVGECYMIDDHDVDFMCLVEGQPVRLRLIVLIEVRTRRVMAYVARPRLKEEDGTMRSITRRDVMHLLAGWLYKFGVPRDYPSVLHVENAAATVSPLMAEVMTRITGGRLTVDRTALYSGVARLASFRQTGGTPTGKPVIESKFRLLDIELAHVRGATGRNYIHKPEELSGRLQATKQLIDRARDLPELAQSDLAELVLSGKVKPPFTSLREAHDEIGSAIARMDARTWHEMEGFLTVPEFRTAPDSGMFYPLHRELFDGLTKDEKDMVQEFYTYPEALQTRMVAQWGRVRAETSAECWLRLCRGVPWLSISQAAVFDLLCDAQPHEYKGTHSIRLNIAGQGTEFRGRLDAAPGTKLVCRFNAENPEAIWVQDHAGRVLTTMARVERLGFQDAAAHREAAEFKATNLARAIQQVRMYEANDPAARAEIQDRADLAALMDTFEGEHARPVPAAMLISESSDELVAAAEGRTRGTPPPQDDAAAFLKNL
jgi:hypothetical protein